MLSTRDLFRSKDTNIKNKKMEKGCSMQIQSKRIWGGNTNIRKKYFEKKTYKRQSKLYIDKESIYQEFLTVIDIHA